MLLRPVRDWRIPAAKLWLVLIIIALFIGLWHREYPLVKPLFLRTVEVKRGAWEISGRCNGQIIREEKKVRSPISGEATALVTQAARVNAGAVVAEINDSFRRNLLQQRIAEISEARERVLKGISNLQEKSAGKKDFAQQIAVLEEEIREATLYGETDRVKALLAEMERLRKLAEEQAAGTAGEHFRLKSDLAALEKELESLKDQLAATSRVLKSPAEGIVLFAKDLDRVIAGTVVFRVVDDTRLHIKTVVPGEFAWKKGEQGIVAIKDRALAVTATFVSSTGEKEQEVDFLLKDALPELLERDQITFTLTKRECEGEVIPRTALVYEAGKTGVYCLQHGAPVFRTVEVLAGEGELIVKGLPEGLRVIANPWLL